MKNIFRLPFFFLSVSLYIYPVTTVDKMHNVWGNEKCLSFISAYSLCPGSDIFLFVISCWQTKRYETFFLAFIFIRLHWRYCTVAFTVRTHWYLQETRKNMVIKWQKYYNVSDIILQIKLSGDLSLFRKTTTEKHLRSAHLLI